MDTPYFEELMTVVRVTGDTQAEWQCKHKTRPSKSVGEYPE